MPTARKEAFENRQHVFRAVFQRSSIRLLSAAVADDTKPKPMTRARFRVTKTQARYGPGKHSQVVSRQLAPSRVPRWTAEKKYAQLLGDSWLIYLIARSRFNGERLYECPHVVLVLMKNWIYSSWLFQTSSLTEIYFDTYARFSPNIWFGEKSKLRLD